MIDKESALQQKKECSFDWLFYFIFNIRYTKTKNNHNMAFSKL